MEIKGIDVSKYQGEIDWEKVRADGYEFAIIRVGWCGYDGLVTQGFDNYFDKNMKGATEAGLNIGVYLYSYAKTPEAAVVAAGEVLKFVEPYNLLYPIMFDFEDAELYSGFSRDLNSRICSAFLNEIEANNYYSMLYSYTYFLSAYLDMTTLEKYDLWVADYRGYVGYTGDYGIWQYSSTGSVDGIVGNVDLNISYKDYPAIIKAAGLNGQLPETEPFSDEDTALIIGFASSGDIDFFVSLCNDLSLAILKNEDGFITTAKASAQSQIVLIDSAKKLSVSIEPIFSEEEDCEELRVESENLKTEIIKLNEEIETLKTTVSEIKKLCDSI